MIVSKQRILDEYQLIFHEYPNDVKRIAAISEALGVHTDEVVQVIYQIEVEA